MPKRTQLPIHTEQIALSPPEAPCRSLLRSRPTRIIGQFHVPRFCPYVMEWESKLERNVLLTLLLCHDITALFPQPIRLRLAIDGCLRFYTPDVLLYSSDGPRLLEVKPYAQLAKRAQEYLAIHAELAKQSATLDFATEAEAGSATRLSNLGLLQRYLNFTLTDERERDILQAIPSRPCPVEAIIAQVGVQPYELLCLIAQRKLFIEMDIPYGPRSMVVRLPHASFGLSYASIFAASGCNVALQKAPLDSGHHRQWPPAPPKAFRRGDLSQLGFGFVGGFPERYSLAERKTAGAVARPSRC